MALIPLAPLILLLAWGSGPAQSPPRAAAVDPGTLHFTVVRPASAVLAATPPQVVFVEQASDVAWTASTDVDWLDIRPAHGLGTARLTLSLVPARAAAAPSRTSGRVFIDGRDGGRRALHVSLRALRPGSGPPVGVLEQPSTDGAALDGRLTLSGWALDDVGVTAVEICADRPPRSGSGGASCADPAKLLIGLASFAHGGRPDVEAAFPDTPFNRRSSWSFTLEREALPETVRGSFRLHAVAVDVEGQSATIGGRTVTVLPAASTSWVPSGVVMAAAGVVAVFLTLALAVRRRFRRVAGVYVPPAAAARPQALELAAVAIVAAVSLALNASGATRGLGYDEQLTASLFVVDVPLVETLTGVKVFNNHVGYSVVARMFASVLGPAEWALRLPAILFGAGATVAIWRLTRGMAGARAGVLAALLLACSPFFVEWSRSARGYSGLALAAVLSTYWFLTCARTGSRAWAHALVTIAAVYFHLYGVWLVPMQSVWFLWLVHRNTRGGEGQAATAHPDGLRRLWWSFTAIVVVVFLLYLPMLDALAEVGAARGQRTTGVKFAADLTGALVGMTSWPGAALLLALAAAGVWRLRARMEAGYLLALLVVPLAIVWFVVRPHDLWVRFFVYWMPFFASLVATGSVFCADAIVGRLPWGAIPRRRFLATVVAGLLLVIPLGSWLRANRAPLADPGYRQPLMDLRASGLPIVAVGRDSDMFGYYLGKPLRVLTIPQEADALMYEGPGIAVAYHAVPNPSERQKAIGSLLERRCRRGGGGPVVSFECRF